jgi:hypothetical protein
MTLAGLARNWWMMAGAFGRPFVSREPVHFTAAGASSAEGAVVALVGVHALVRGVLPSLAALRFRAAHSASAALAGPRVAGHRRTS